jgi:hypothetical protein
LSAEVSSSATAVTAKQLIPQIMARFLQYVGLLGLLPVAWCRVGYDLRPTQTNFATDQFDFEWGWTPMPTSAPRVLVGLQRRQQQQYAPNATCGFVSGSKSEVLLTQ